MGSPRVGTVPVADAIGAGPRSGFLYPITVECARANP